MVEGRFSDQKLHHLLVYLSALPQDVQHSAGFRRKRGGATLPSPGCPPVASVTALSSWAAAGTLRAYPEGQGEDKMQIDAAGVERIADEVYDHEEQYVAGPLDNFWAQLGVVNPLQELQEQVAVLFAEQGLVVSFEAHVFVPDEDLPMKRDFDVPPSPVPLDLKAEWLRALSVQQPWVELILSGEKNIEYRSRRMREMGPLLLHASKTIKQENFERVSMEAEIDTLPYGALVGVVDVVDVVAVEGQDGLFEWRLAHPRRFAMPIPYSGAAGIFRVPMNEIKMYLRSVMV